jgi:hypothetical protein
MNKLRNQVAHGEWAMAEERKGTKTEEEELNKGQGAKLNLPPAKATS